MARSGAHLRPDPGKTPVDIQPITLRRTPTRAATAALLIAISLALLLVRASGSGAQAPQPAPQQALSASPLDGYIAGIARAWEPYTTADGRVNDPLDPADTGDNYGVILLADVMLKVARRTGDGTLEGDATRIVNSALTLPVPNDPFNLLAIAAVIHDGQDGEFPTDAWEEIAAPLMQRAGEIAPPAEASCLTEPLCYDNWRLVWSAGASLLLSDGVSGVPGSLASHRALASTQIRADLSRAAQHAGAPLELTLAGERAHIAHGEQAGPGKTGDASGKTGNPPGKRERPSGTLTGPTAGAVARELSDPGAEPPAYELFSTFMLELIGEVNPQAITSTVARLRRQADRYALDMMAPDGQLSLSGRSLDQSWVQAAAAALGARRAALEPSEAGAWRAYADRAFSYLLDAYPLRADGLLPIVPGLSLEWNPAIMDGYAALNQYEGLTLWLLSDALARWPSPEAPRAPLPSDNHELLADDLGSSGLVWGRAGRVWWQLSGRSTSGDPRSAQGLVAVKLGGAGGWRDLLALRPRQRGASSVWTLDLKHGLTATPTFTRVRGAGGRVVLTGNYRLKGGHSVGRAVWMLTTTPSGITLAMSMPKHTTLHTTIWLAGGGQTRLSATTAAMTRHECVVTASGRACPVTIYWPNQRSATLEVGA